MRPLGNTSAVTADRFLASRRRSARAAKRAATPADPAPRVRPPYQPKHERLPISREQIEALLAGAGGDVFFARICRRALAGNQDAINACKAALYGLD